MQRRAMLGLLAAMPLGAGCTQAPGAAPSPYLFGAGDPVRGTALNAPSVFGDLSQYAGRPADAAEAVAQLEFLTDAFHTDPRYSVEVNPAPIQALDMARAQVRGQLGITPDATPQLVIAALRTAAAGLRDASPARAEAALSTPAFTAGPRGTLARLGSLPALPQTSIAANMASSEISRMGRSGGRRGR